MKIMKMRSAGMAVISLSSACDVTRAASVLKRAAKTERAPVQCMGAGEKAVEVREDEVTVEARAAEVRVVAARVEVRAEGAMALCGTGEPCAHLWQNYGEREADQ